MTSSGAVQAALLQRDRLLVGRQLVVPRPVERGEGLELVERALLLEHLGVGLDRDRRVEQAGNAVDRKLLRHRMRRGIGAEEDSTPRRRSRPARSASAVLRGLDHRHAVHVRLQSPAEPVGAREHHVIGRDRAADLRRGAAHEIDAVLRRQMLEDHAQAGKLLRPMSTDSAR